MRTVVFACRHNAGRSQIAAAFFNRDADPEHASAVSAGTTPGARVHPEVITVMSEIGVDLSHASPKLLTPELAAGATLLVTMGCGEECPYLPGVEVEDWPLEDPKGLPVERVREIRDDIERRVSAFLQRRGWARTAAH
jgi:arsenate reductase (thioredoxin)